MLCFVMVIGIWFHWMIFRILLDASGCITLNTNMTGQLIVSKLVLWLRDFINDQVDLDFHELFGLVLNP